MVTEIAGGREDVWEDTNIAEIIEEYVTGAGFENVRADQDN